MALVIPNDFVPGQPNLSGQVDANFNAVKVFVDLLQAGTNIDPGAIIAALLATDSVTPSKIQALAVTAAKLALDVPDYDQIVLAGQVFG